MLSVLSGEMTIVRAARCNAVAEQSVSRWKQQFLKAGIPPWPRAVDSRGGTRESGGWPRRSRSSRPLSGAAQGHGPADR